MRHRFLNEEILEKTAAPRYRIVLSCWEHVFQLLLRGGMHSSCLFVCLFAFANLRGILTRKCSMATTGHDHVKSTPQTFPGRPDNQTLPGQSGKGSDFFWWPCWKPPPHPMSTFFFLNTSLCSLEETSSDVLLLGPLLDSWYATSRPAFSMIESGSRKDRRCSAQLLHFLESWQANWG